MWELLNKRMKGKANTNGFDKNKGNIVCWRPKKGISLCNQQLKEAWYEPATKQDIEVNYMNLLNLEESELSKMQHDTKQPMLIRIIIKNMLWDRWFDVIEKILDRGIGKAVQKEESRLVDKEWEDREFNKKEIDNKPIEELKNLITTYINK